MWSNSTLELPKPATQVALGWRPTLVSWGSFEGGWGRAEGRLRRADPRAGSVDHRDRGVRHHEAGELGRVLGDDLLTARPRDRGQAVVELDEELAHA